MPAGIVLEVRVDGDSATGGVLLEPGETVELVVSNGPAPRTVPNLIGLPVENAISEAAAVQLKVTEAAERQFSESVPVGATISQDIPGGTQVPRGQAVVVTVSKGPDRRQVPNVAGMSIGDATAALEAVGLVRAGIQGPGNVVQFSDPAAGTALRPGDPVTLFAPPQDNGNGGNGGGNGNGGNSGRGNGDDD